MMDITDIRQKLHNHPDVSGKEQFAHDLIIECLKDLAPTELNTNVGGYGVVAYWRAQIDEAKTVAFRADIDALPIGHRCGHDGHTTIMLRFAEIVASKELKYNVVLVFQQEEETGMGAKKIVDTGLLDKYKVCAVFGLHNLPGYKKGVVVLKRHTFASASCGVIYKFRGRESHASTPEKGLNPGLAIAEMIQRMEKLNDYNISSLRLSTLICCRVGDEAFGTSAGKGEVMFTLRTITNNGMYDLMEAADKISIDVAHKFGLELEKQLREPFKATENTPELVDQLCDIFSEHSVNTEVEEFPFRWSEDFAEYLQKYQGAFFGLGSGEKQPELHNPAYIFPDDIIETGAQCFRLILDNIKI
ncbi:MAG: amidohydrolase [Bacteroidales bacterium]|nr:amidohydrolase [Bacteroidales bacterium]